MYSRSSLSLFKTNSKTFGHPGRAAELREAFSLIDRDNDGLITIEDLKDSLRDVEIREDAEHLLSSFKNNSVSLVEYLSFMGKVIAEMESSEDLISAFEVIEPSGAISKEALKGLIGEENYAKSQGIIRECLNEHGQVDYKKFSAIISLED